MYNVSENIRSINVTYFVNKFLSDSDIFENLIRDLKITEVNIGIGYNYPKFVVQNKIYNLYGQFIDYLIRHIIGNYKNIIVKDFRTEHVLSQSFDRYGDVNNVKKTQLFNDYKKYISKVESKQIINSIFNVSLCHSLYFAHYTALNYVNTNIDVSSINYDKLYDHITNKIKNIDKDKILLNPSVGINNIYVKGDADLICDDNLIDFKVSKNDMGQNIIDFYQLIIYAVLFQSDTNKKINKLTIFNPLKMIEYNVDLSNWNNEIEVINLMKMLCIN